MDSKSVGPSKRIAMFASYCGGLQYPEIASEFKLDVATVRYIARTEEWVKRRAEFLEKYRRKALKSTEEELTKSIRICDSLLAQLLKEFKSDIENDKGSRVIPQDRVDVILRILDKKLKYLGLTPTTGGGVSVDMSQNVTLQGMSSEALEALKRNLLADLGLEGTVKEADIVKLTGDGAKES